jgi:hypothetical protein
MTESRTIRSKSEDPVTPTTPHATPTSDFRESFLAMNERAVEEISLNFFYRPHTISLLFASIIAASYFAFVR